MAKARNYCFTVNNYTPEELEQVKAVACSYLVVGQEVGEEGTPHLQGYIEFENPRAFKAVKNLLPRAHLEQRRGTAQQASEYCKKEANFYEVGTISRQGKRTDLEEVKELVSTGKSMSEIVEVATSYQTIRCAEILMKYKEKCRDWEPVVKWFYGPTGTGKTRTALEELGSRVYTCMDSIRWFEGYDGHENVLIDDIRSSFATYTQLLRLLDRYAYRVETKGGSRQFLARVIIITAPFPPDQLYPHLAEDVGQLLRRISEIRSFCKN